MAGDQCGATGYAVDLSATNYLPPERWLAWRVSRRLRQLRDKRPNLMLGPDGRLLVGLAHDGDRRRLAMLTASLQQAAEGDPVTLHRALREVLASELRDVATHIPGLDPRPPDEIAVNGAGAFDAGPDADNGLSGKKLVMNMYGPHVPIGGGALCGKDLYRVDRAATILARGIAKAVVRTSAAEECLATLCASPGATEARIVSLRVQDRHALDIGRWGNLLDPSLAGVGDRYTGDMDLREVADQGHFTTPDPMWGQVKFD